jgi:AAA+ superfamily predicted ATPase
MPIKWFEELKAKYEAAIAHTFLLHFNVGDYVVNNTDLKNYLLRALASFDLTAIYNRAEGIVFPLPSMKDKFMQWLEIAPADPALEALNFASGATDTSLPREPNPAFALLEKMLKLDRTDDDNPDRKVRSALIIEFAETLFPNTDISTMNPEDRNSLIHMLRWSKDPGISANGNLIILITSNLSDIHPAIRAAGSRIESVTIQLPEYEERLAFIKSFPDLTLEEGFAPEAFAGMTGLLSKIHIEDIILRAKYNQTPVSRQLVKERKAEIIRSEYEDVLEMEEPEVTFDDIGGMEHIKEFFQNNIIQPIKSGEYDAVPLGVLMMGASGTGKTFTAEAVAKESGFNFIRLDLSRILGGIVGSTEKNWSKATRGIEASSPAIVLIDEIDQKVRRGEYSNSEVENRLFAGFLTWMSNEKHRGRIVILACTNRPDLMDAAMKRPGRFDKKIAFLPPGPQERLSVLQAVCRKHGIAIKTTPAIEKTFTQQTEGWTQAEIRSLVAKAREVSRKRKSTTIEDGDIMEALDKLTPSTQDVEFMTNLAIREIDDKDLLPPQYQQKLANRKELQEKIDRYKETERRAPRTL